jgi:hypothetical protein
MQGWFVARPRAGEPTIVEGRIRHGMTAHLERTDGLLSLERTGPYIPPITLPGIDDVVVNAAARGLLESSGAGREPEVGELGPHGR